LRPYLKIPTTKRAGGVTQGEGSEFKPQYHKIKKEKAEYQTIYCMISTCKTGKILA
jgi:hypothetical protein